MKKFFVYILAFLYISSSTGADVYLQHRLNDLSEPGLNNHTFNTSGFFGKDNNEKLGKYCCAQENRHLKFKTDHIAAGSVHHLHHPVSVTSLSANYIIQSAGHSFIAKENPVRSPLLQTNHVAFYIRNCVFLI